MCEPVLDKQIDSTGVYIFQKLLEGMHALI